MTFGNSSANFLIDSPAAVAQVIGSKFRLWTGEWFLNLNSGTPWNQAILGKSRPTTRDAAIRSVVLSTPFVNAITPGSYVATVNPQRGLSVSMEVVTAFGPITVTLPFAPTPVGPFELGFSPVGGTQGVG
jgi:hypothetical protein